MGRRGKGELTYKQHEDTVKHKLYEQKKEIERLSLENATLRIKIKAQDKKAEIYNMMIDEAIVDLEDCIGILCLLDESGLAIRDYLEGKGLLKQYVYYVDEHKKEDTKDE
nr:MAG TPA: hypothetical protein [Caudoviricetes sp.]